MTSKISTLIITAAIVIAMAVTAYSQLTTVLSGVLEQAAKVEKVR